MRRQKQGRKGQNFLVDRKIIERIADYACLSSSDRVLEIGPGTGNLTEVLSERAGLVYAVEVDPALASSLKGRFRNVEVINGDALKTDLDLLDFNKIVSNLPYQISTKITYKLLSRTFDLAILMYQKEFASRLAAKHESERYGRLAVTAQFFCDIEVMETVPRSAFRPEPDVSSAIVRLWPRNERASIDSELFIGFVEGLFNNRRKKIRKALAAMGVPRERIEGLEAELVAEKTAEMAAKGDGQGVGVRAGIDAALLDKRPEELTPDEAACLAGSICAKMNTS